VAPYLTPQWGDIPAKRWRIHPRPKAVAFCCRGNDYGRLQEMGFEFEEFVVEDGGAFLHVDGTGYYYFECG
jgi:hypothetical protein